MKKINNTINNIKLSTQLQPLFSPRIPFHPTQYHLRPTPFRSSHINIVNFDLPNIFGSCKILHTSNITIELGTKNRFVTLNNNRQKWDTRSPRFFSTNKTHSKFNEKLSNFLSNIKTILSENKDNLYNAQLTIEKK